MNNRTPFFSTIIPTYNRASQVVIAIHSILNQSFQNFEIIVVDDGSEDNTKVAVGHLCEVDNRIRYFYKQNEERSIARNFGIEKAVGKYVSFLDSDDLIYSNHFEVAFSLLERNEFPEVGHLGFETIDEKGHRLSVTNQLDSFFKEKLIYENFLHGNAIFIRRDIARQVNFIPSKFAILSEDWYVWLRLAARFPFYFDNTITSAVVHHKDRSLLNIDPDKLILNTRILIEHLKNDTQFMIAYKRKSNYHFANHCTLTALHLSLTKNRKRESILFLKDALQYHFGIIITKRFLATIKKILKQLI